MRYKNAGNVQQDIKMRYKMRYKNAEFKENFAINQILQG